MSIVDETEIKETKRYEITITIADVDSPSVTLTAMAAATVADAPLSAIGAPISAVEGIALANVPVAVLTEDKVKERAAQVLDDVVALLTSDN